MRFEVRFTHDFIRRFLPAGCERILEIGCGSGELAVRLRQDGFQVVAIDPDEESVGAARRLGVDARLADWPDFHDGLFDAVLFTRSLHHIHPLREAVQRAVECLADGGRIIVEDFAYECADEKTLRWFTSAARLLEAAGLLVAHDELLDAVLREGASLAIWRAHHDHDLSTAAEIEAELEMAAGDVVRENAAYYFRYLTKAMVDADRRDAVARALAEQESELVSSSSIVSLGRRFVAPCRPRT